MYAMASAHIPPPIASPRFGFGGFCLLVAVIAFGVQQGCSVTGNPTSWAWGLFWFLFVAIAAILGVWLWDHTARRHWIEKGMISVFLLLFVGRFSYDPIVAQYRTEHPPQTVAIPSPKQSEAETKGPPDKGGSATGEVSTGASKMPKGSTRSPSVTSSTASVPIPTTSVIQNNTQGINIGPGATAPNATVVNNGPPPPKVTWHTEKSKVSKSGVDAIVSVDKAVPIPAFLAICNVPCRSLIAIVPSAGVVWDDGAMNYSSPQTPTTAIVLMNTARLAIGFGTDIQWSIEPVNETDSLSLLDVTLMPEEQAKRLPLPKR
jgi:hypothetical protein